MRKLLMMFFSADFLMKADIIIFPAETIHSEAEILPVSRGSEAKWKQQLLFRPIPKGA